MTVKRLCPKCDYDLGLHGKESQPILHKYCDSCSREFDLDAGYEIVGFPDERKHYCSWPCIDPSKVRGEFINIQYLGPTVYKGLGDRDVRLKVILDK